MMSLSYRGQSVESVKCDAKLVGNWRERSSWLSGGKVETVASIWYVNLSVLKIKLEKNWYQICDGGKNPKGHVDQQYTDSLVQNKYSFFIFMNNILLCSVSAFGHNLTKIKQTVMVVQYAEPKIRNKEHATRTKSTATSTSNRRQAPCTLRQNEERTPAVTQFMHDIRVSDSKIKTLISETVPRHGWSPQFYIFTILDKVLCTTSTNWPTCNDQSETHVDLIFTTDVTLLL